MKERKTREKYCELLAEHIRLGNLTSVTSWRSFVRVIKDDRRYLELVGQSGSTPKDLFDDAVEE